MMDPLETRPRRVTSAASCARLVTPSLAKACARCVLTVAAHRLAGAPQTKEKTGYGVCGRS
jgi:hypothetical protein